MKNLRLSPRKLDGAADIYFELSKPLKGEKFSPAVLERWNLAGIALRRWAQQMRSERLKARHRQKARISDIG